MERAEARLGPLHYRDKVHTVLRSAYELAIHPTLLDVVEQCIGSDILLYNATYIVKEPGSASHVSWHQDLTYWGLDDPDAQVSAWLALASATEQSGCMSMVPGSHLGGRREHQITDDRSNVLLMGQRIEGFEHDEATVCALAPGEMSLHHGWTVHSSGPNRSDDRRIGLNIQYLAPHNRHVGEGQVSAMLVRGDDRFGHFGVDEPPAVDLKSAALDRWKELDDGMKRGFTSGVDPPAGAAPG